MAALTMSMLPAPPGVWVTARLRKPIAGSIAAVKPAVANLLVVGANLSHSVCLAVKLVRSWVCVRYGSMERARLESWKNPSTRRS